MVGARAAIILYVHELAHTGVVRNTLAVADALSKDGYGVQIVTALPGGQVPSGIEHVVLLGGPTRRRRLEQVAVIPALRRYLRRNRPAVAVSMGNHSHAVMWGAAIGLRNIRRVYRISNDLARTMIGAPGGGPLKRWMRATFSRLLIHHADALVLVSPSLLEDPTFAAAEAESRAVVIPNGVDVGAARRQAGVPLPHPWLGGDLPVVLAIGRLAPQKNFSTLLKAVALLNRQRAARLVILGESRDSARLELAAQAEQLGIADRLLLPGTVDNVFAWLACADVFALPSWWEGSPNVLLEAMAIGTPVVASRTAGNARSIIGDRYGRLVDPACPRAMASAIALQIDPATQIGPGDRALAYDARETMDSWGSLMGDLLDASPPSFAQRNRPRLRPQLWNSSSQPSTDLPLASRKPNPWPPSG